MIQMVQIIKNLIIILTKYNFCRVIDGFSMLLNLKISDVFLMKIFFYFEMMIFVSR